MQASDGIQLHTTRHTLHIHDTLNNTNTATNTNYDNNTDTASLTNTLTNNNNTNINALADTFTDSHNNIHTGTDIDLNNYYFLILFITSINGIIVIGYQANQFPKIGR